MRWKRESQPSSSGALVMAYYGDNLLTLQLLIIDGWSYNVAYIIRILRLIYSIVLRTATLAEENWLL